MKDVQNQNDTRKVEIQKVGINNFDIPLNIQRKNNTNQVVNACARATVSLPMDYKGTHMSRFVEVLSEWQTKNLLGIDIKGCVEEIVRRLNAKNGELKFTFKYFIEKIAPVSKLPSQMCYECTFKGKIIDNNYKFVLGINVPITTLCPCSKEISENGAHNQRAYVKLKVSYDEDKHIWIEDLVELVESCASCQLYPLLKREDEKFVTEKAWNNPKFVEDVLRDVVVKLREHPIVNEFEVECEAQESIHNHSAWAYQKEVC